MTREDLLLQALDTWQRRTVGQATWHDVHLVYMAVSSAYGEKKGDFFHQVAMVALDEHYQEHPG